MMEDETIAARLRFHGITVEVGVLLREHKSYIMSVLPDGLDAFYDHVAAFPETARFFRDRAHMMHAKAMQLRHWDLICDGRFDGAYVASVTRIGEVHNKIGLEPKWYVGGYNFLLVNMLGRISQDLTAGFFRRGGAAKALALQQAITRALMLDMDYAIAVYLEAGRRERRQTLDGLAQNFNASIGNLVGGLSQSVEHLQSEATGLAASAEEASVQSSIVSTASEEAAASVHSVAAATEEMSASSKEIGRQVVDSATIAARAVQVTGDTVHKVGRLSEAAGRIGSIVDLISNIAAQTNLLALNATIEAARAGDAGRGFAVVAHEVKALADQTAKATAEIGAQIGEMQVATNDTSGAINQISEINQRMSDIASSILDAVHQQNQATDEIAQNVQNASRGSGEVSHNIGGVSRAAQQTGQSATEVQTTATELSMRARDLQREVDSFLGAIAVA
jgi:methyl-accepting chemotaxis protein